MAERSHNGSSGIDSLAAAVAPRNGPRGADPLGDVIPSNAPIVVELATEELDAIAERADDLLAARQAAVASPWLSTEQAADYLAPKALSE
jgi:hypothetical protein